MKTLNIIGLSILFMNLAIAQKVIRPDIQYVTLTDTVLILEIKKYIKEEEKVDTLFARGKGYINVSFSYKRKNGHVFSNNPHRVDTVFTYCLMTSFMSTDGKENTLDDMYPSFYSMIDGRLICIDTDGYRVANKYFGFSEKSKKKYRKILAKYLDPVGSKSRTWLILNREMCIFFLRKIDSTKEYDSYVTVKIKR